MRRDTNPKHEGGTDSTEMTSSAAAIPIIKEEVIVGKKTVETGRITVEKRVGFTDRVIELPLTETHYEEKRVTFNHQVDELPKTRTEGDTLIIPVVREEIVMTKRIVLLEEIHLTKVVSREDRSETVRLHQESITIKRE